MNAKPEPLPEIVEYEMGYGADEFGKVLLGPFTGERTDFKSIEIDRHRWRISLADTTFVLMIEVDEAPPRKIGLFNLPVLKVRFRFEQAEPEQRERFLHRFHQYFHKGGG